MNELILTRNLHLAHHAFWRWRPDPKEPSFGLVCVEEGARFGFPNWQSSITTVRVHYTTAPQATINNGVWHRVWLPDPCRHWASVDDQPPVMVTEELYNLLLDRLTVYYHVEAP